MEDKMEEIIEEAVNLRNHWYFDESSELMNLAEKYNNRFSNNKKIKIKI